MDTDDFLEINVRPAEQIAKRILVLHAIVQRVLIEDANDRGSDEALFDLRASLTLSGADRELTPGERAVISSPAGQIDEGDRYASAWEIEALNAILAATGLLDSLPTPPELSDASVIDRLLGDHEPNIGRLTDAINLPDDESVARERETAELWHWRALAEYELRNSGGRDRAQLEANIREVTGEAGAAGLIEISTAGDFETGGRSMAEWTDDELAAFELAAESRLRALNWLCGFGSSWSDVPLVV